MCLLVADDSLAALETKALRLIGKLKSLSGIGMQWVSVWLGNSTGSKGESWRKCFFSICHGQIARREQLAGQHLIDTGYRYRF